MTVADKYCVKGLKKMCELKMCKYLNKDNALEYLELAVTYEVEKLMSLETETMYLISLNLKDFIKKPEFGELGMKYPEVLLELMKYHFDGE